MTDLAEIEGYVAAYGYGTPDDYAIFPPEYIEWLIAEVKRLRAEKPARAESDRE